MPTDHEGEELVVAHVIPYRVLSDEYGDYSYQKEHDTGELVAPSLDELASKLRALTVEHVLRWVEGTEGMWGRVHLPDPRRLESFKYGLDRHGCYTDFGGKIARAPESSLTYVEIGAYRVELRLEHGAAPELPTESHGFETVIPALEAALVEARDRLTARIAQLREAERVASEARKRAELAKLKAELGES